VRPASEKVDPRMHGFAHYVPKPPITQRPYMGCRGGRHWARRTSPEMIYAMSALGQKRTFAPHKVMSALSLIATVKADIAL
jgi:hypothetical protein